MKAEEEQNAAHSFDKEEDDIRGYYEPDDRPQSMKDLAEKLRLEKQIELAELTRLRSELRQKDEVIEELILIAQWKLQSTTNYLSDFKESKESDPGKFAEVDRLQSIIERAKEILKSKAK